MPDDLYDRDILDWSERQADLLRRLAARERLNEAVDWDNLIEEVESAGRLELKRCTSLLRQAVIHLIKLKGEPHSPAVPHWRGQVVMFLTDARDAFAPSMRQHIDLA